MGFEQPNKLLFAGEYGLPFMTLSGATRSRTALFILRGAIDQPPPLVGLAGVEVFPALLPSSRPPL